MALRFVDAEVLRVAPGDTLIVRLAESASEWASDLVEELDRLGLGARAVVICADGVEFAVARDEP